MIENYGKLHVEQAPFPHAVVDGWWNDGILTGVLGEFPSEGAQGWQRFQNSTERKLGGHPGMWGPVTRMFIEGQMQAKAGELAEAFGTPELTMETVGGGYHLIEPGGYLAMHADFSRSPETGRYRWLNMLVYLNDAWQGDQGGQLQLWDDNGPAVTVLPEFNRTVVFRTSGESWHGHPIPTTRHRRSVAAYFYAETPPPGYVGDHSTRWHPKAGQPGA
jgi:hypothetical protein